MSIQTKTTLLFTALAATVFLLLMATVYYFSNQYANFDFYKRLELRARISAKFSFEKDHVTTESFKQIQKEYLERLQDERSYIVKLSDKGEPLAPIPADLPLSYLRDIAAAAGGTVYHRNKFVHYAGLLYNDETGNFLVIESALNSYGNEIITQLRNILVVTLLVSIVVIYATGLYFSRKTFAPFSDITSKVLAISEGNLHLRLTERQGEDEVAGLVNTFNTMLDRLETAFETQANFISNASHELRTPLTAIIAETDYVLSQQRPAQVYVQSLGNIAAQAERLQQLTRGLLSLAQTDFDGKKQQWESVRIDQLIYDVKENVRAIFSNKIVIALPNMPERPEDISITGNYSLLAIALGNIVLNACKYSGEAAVTIELSIDEKTATIKIADKGIGIPADEIRHVFDPFFRASNTGDYEGYGIGMPLSQNIIRMHRGKIRIYSDVNEGTIFFVILPIG